MKRLLDAWSITQKLGAAFGIVLLTLLAVSLAGLRGASSTETNARRVVEHLQPAVFSVMMLESRVQAAAASMGFYLKGQEEGQKQRFQNDIAALSGALERAREALAALDDAQLTRGFDALADLVGRFAAFEPRLVELVSMPSKNIPAMALAEQRLNPLHMIILQAMDEMLAAERDADQEYLEDLSAVALAPDDELGQPTLPVTTADRPPRAGSRAAARRPPRRARRDPGPALFLGAGGHRNAWFPRIQG